MDDLGHEAPPPSYQLEQQRHDQTRPDMILNDASVNAFELGEEYSANSLVAIDQLPLNERQRLERQGPANNRMILPHFQDDASLAHIPFSLSDHDTTVEFLPEQKRRRFKLFKTHQVQDTDVTAQATDPWIALDPDSGATVHYFEIDIVSVGRPDVVLAIGLATKPYPWFRLPGWNKHSVAYHSDDGNKFLNDPTVGYVFGPSYGVGDVVGCLYHVEQGSVYFTLNGSMIQEPAFVGLDLHVYYPSIGADGPAKVRVNFGAQPFKYACPSWVGHVYPAPPQ
ncbi:SPRY-domain-containing protein [Hesseltinella vesiculosa]|uniref:SPRY-domain-containing protein n=1 Tax=Hesseltinella vesiculosa TaxID=101127 RepID=A0A1X2G6X3_9FUNG|nr:SPRY-domain-containing protein [Hesseltinella vesiculosa]